ANGLRGDEPHLPDLVPTEGKANRIVALDEQARAAAERGAQPRHLFDRRRGRGERDRRERVETAEHKGFSILAMFTISGPTRQLGWPHCSTTSNRADRSSPPSSGRRAPSWKPRRAWTRGSTPTTPSAG